MGGGGGYNQRPAPYDRGNRFGGMNRFNNGRGNRGGNRGGKYADMDKFTFCILKLVTSFLISLKIVGCME